MITKSNIIAEIKRTALANGGVPLGRNRFEAATSIRRTDWFGVYWARWGDAVNEAGFKPNQLQAAFDEEELLYEYAKLAQELGRLPVGGDLALRRRADPKFPSPKTFDRLGRKAKFIRRLADFCRSREGFENIFNLCDAYAAMSESSAEGEERLDEEVAIGYVYLIQHGSRREFKIGRTNNRLRREGEIGIELPDKVEPIHVIETDDPAGVEVYWHRRFAEKRLNSEWFALTVDEVRAFKRWRRIC